MRVNEISIDGLRELYAYDAASGAITRKVRTGNTTHVGEAVGTLHSGGYIRIRIGGRAGYLYYAHRVAWAITHGYWPQFDIDHINGVRTDNRLANLREATRQQNLANAKAYPNTVSGYKGVNFHAKTKKWVASIRVRGERFHLGLFSTPKEAHEAYMARAIQENGEYARAR